MATVLSEEGNKIVHRLEPRGIDHRAAVAADGDQSGKAQPVEMKGERIRGETEFFGDLAGGMPSGPACTSRRKISRRLSWASALKAATAFDVSIFQVIWK